MAKESNELGITISSNVDEANKKLDKLIGLMEKGSGKTDKLVKSASNISKAFNFGALYSSAKKVFDIFSNSLHEINHYSETLNMFNLTMGEMEKKANNFQKKMAYNFGNNSQEQLYYQSLYQSLTESMGMQEKYAYIISENMTKLAYDLSSLYDKEQKNVAEALRSGLIGQTKPVRQFGLDITENSLQPILDSLQIDRTVRQLSQAEKEIVRYIALIRQSAIAHGDMANTIESPANQLRILKNQLVECTRWFGALFIGMFSKILPYINAVVMTIVEVLKALGSLFGIKIQDYNSGLVTFSEDVNDGLETIGDSAGASTKKVKELKRQLLGFDQVNNINEDDNDYSGSGSGSGGVSGGIDQRLLDALEDYDNGMDKVRMKAREISEELLKWLGFIYDDTEGIWKLSDGWNNFKTIVTVVGTILGLIVGSKIITGIIKLGKAFSIAWNGIKLFGMAISSLFTGTSNVALSGTAFTKLSSVLGTINVGFSKLASTLGMTSGTLAGIVAVILAVAVALVHAYNHSENFRNKVNELGENIKTIFGGIYEKIYEVVDNVMTVIMPLVKIGWDTVLFIIKYLYEGIVLTFSNILDIINGTIETIGLLLDGDFKGAFERMGETVGNIRENLKIALNGIGEHFKEWIEKTKKNIDEFKEKIKEKWEEFKKDWKERWNKVTEWFNELPSKITYGIGYIIGLIIKSIIELPEKIYNKLVIFVTETLPKWKTNIENWVNKELPKIIDKIVQWFKDLPQKIYDKLVGKFNEKVGSFNNIGSFIFEGIKNGFMNKINRISEMTDGFIKGIKKALGINSPARSMIPIGMYTFMGIEKGMEEEIPNVEKTAYKLLNTLETTFDDGMYDLSLKSAITPNLTQDISNVSTYSAKTNIDYNMLEQASYNGFSKAIKQYGLVNINVKQDKGSIVETAIEGINDITRQTGENPIDLW